MSDERARPRVGALLQFLAFAAAAVALLAIGHGIFPGDRTVARIGRLACSAAAIAAMIFGSRTLLDGDGFRADRLGLAPSASHGRAFLIGAGIAAVHILLVAAVLYAIAPFDVVRGPRSGRDVAWAAADYLTGNCVEELLFRGYLLVAIARWFGTTRAIWILALPFGLFHFPGLDLESLGRMLVTTGAMHFVYAYAFVATRSLWAAVALHAVGNTLLHEISGFDGPAVLSVRFSGVAPTHAPFLAFFAVTVGVALLCAHWAGRQNPNRSRDGSHNPRAA